MKRLTRREKEIITAFAAGQDLGEIAVSHFLSKRTVEWHVANILQKTGTTTLHKALAYLGTWRPHTALWE